MTSGKNAPAQHDDSKFSLEVIRHIESQNPKWKSLTPEGDLFRKNIIIALAAAGLLIYSARVIYISTYVQGADTSKDVWLSVLLAIAGFGVFAIGFAQWRLARHEIVFDKFYERINITNQHINDLYLEEYKNDDNKKIDHLRNMRVFAQLDNLEYVLGKYRYRFVGFDIVDRAIRTFRSDCSDPHLQWFSEKVLFWIGKTDEERVAKGYHSDTRAAARYIVSQCQR